MSYEEEDTWVSYEEEDTCVSYEEEDTCVSLDLLRSLSFSLGPSRLLLRLILSGTLDLLSACHTCILLLISHTCILLLI